MPYQYIPLVRGRSDGRLGRVPLLRVSKIAIRVGSNRHEDAEEARARRQERSRTVPRSRCPICRFYVLQCPLRLGLSVRQAILINSAERYIPPASHSPSGLYDIACQAVLLIGSLNR
jgi:hypothetical protein